MDSKMVLTTQTNNAQMMIDRYAASMDIKAKSKDTYIKGLRNFFRWLSDNSISAPARSDILSYKGYLFHNYSPSTVSTYITAVKSFYSYLESEKINTDNVTAGVKGAKSARGFRKDALTVGQAKRVLSSINQDGVIGARNFAIVNLLTRTALRTVEIERADIADIRQSGGEALLYIQGKGRDEKDEFVVLTEAALRPILDYIAMRGKPSPDEPLFASHSDRNSGGRLTTRSIRRLIKTSFINAGCQSGRLTAHSLRHSAITFSLLGGATLQETQAMARHRNINTTMIYAHNIDRINRAGERKIDFVLDGTIQTDSESVII
jgi:integrase/recombinase XerC/integrase/recombinase XerD